MGGGAQEPGRRNWRCGWGAFKGQLQETPHLQLLTPGVSLYLFLTVDRDEVATWGSRRTIWNAWCSRAKGPHVQYRDI